MFSMSSPKALNLQKCRISDEVLYDKKHSLFYFTLFVLAPRLKSGQREKVLKKYVLGSPDAEDAEKVYGKEPSELPEAEQLA